MQNKFIDLLIEFKSKPLLIHLSIIISFLIMKMSANILDRNPNRTKHLNIGCDISRLGGGGCFLRESYCYYHTCVCKPDFPVNIDDIMCIEKHKKVGEICSIDSECETNSTCVKALDNYKLKRCVCRQGFSFSTKNNACIRGHKGSLCSTSADCSGIHNMCSQSKCQCDYGYDWYQTDEKCYKKSKLGEVCESTVNCRAYDRLSVCDRVHKICICRQSLSQMNAIDVLTQKCIICPLKRYNNQTKQCIPETLEIEYKSSDKSVVNRNSLQYVYIALSISPFVVFAIIGFLYKFVSPRSHGINNIVNNDRQRQVRDVYTDDSIECEIPNTTRIDSNPSNLLVNLSSNENHAIICSPIAPVLLSLIPPRDPPPSYEASQQMPPSYEEAIAASNT